LNHSNKHQLSIHDNMERLQPHHHIVRTVPLRSANTPLSGAWLHRGTVPRVENSIQNLVNDDAEEILLDSNYNAAAIPPVLDHNTSPAYQTPLRLQDDARQSNHETIFVIVRSFIMKPTLQRNRKMYLIWSLIFLVIMISICIGFGIYFSNKQPPTPCTMNSIVEACFVSFDTSVISGCLEERIMRFRQMFDLPFQHHNNDSFICSPENLAIMSVASQLTEDMSNHSVFQRYGLSLLYFATQGGKWIADDNWLSDKRLCEWKYIACLNDSVIDEDDVIEINLVRNNLHGSIPSLFLNYLPNLQTLDLSGNNLMGTIPSSVSKLNKLILDMNRLTGVIPTSLIHSKLMEFLSLRNNYNLSLPQQGQFFSGPNWKEIYLSNNNIDFTFPRVINLLPNLEVLDFGATNLKGEIPSEIGLLSKLLKFTADKTSLTGQLPTEIGLLKSLKVIDVSKNNLNGTIPSQIGFLNHLEKFRVNNNHLVGTLPSELSQNTKLTDLIVAGNMLSGTMPSEFGNLSNLDNFLFSDNKFTGTMPIQVCNLKGHMTAFGDCGSEETYCPNLGEMICPANYSSCCCVTS
jgi:hypothetical protein